jgi:hypothetical protein
MAGWDFAKLPSYCVGRNRISGIDSSARRGPAGGCYRLSTGKGENHAADRGEHHQAAGPAAPEGPPIDGPAPCGGSLAPCVFPYGPPQPRLGQTRTSTRGRCWRLENGLAATRLQHAAETPMNSTIASGFPSCMSRVRFPSPAPIS